MSQGSAAVCQVVQAEVRIESPDPEAQEHHAERIYL